MKTVLKARVFCGLIISLALGAPQSYAQTNPTYCPPDCPVATSSQPSQQTGGQTNQASSVGVNIDVNSVINVLGKAAQIRKERRAREAKARADAIAAQAAAQAAAKVDTTPLPVAAPIPAPKAVKYNGPAPIKVMFEKPTRQNINPIATKVDLSNSQPAKPFSVKLVGGGAQANSPIKSMPISRSTPAINNNTPKVTAMPATTVQPKSIKKAAAVKPPVYAANPAKKIQLQAKPIEEAKMAPIIILDAESKIAQSDQRVGTPENAKILPIKDNNTLNIGWLLAGIAASMLGIFAFMKLKATPENNDREAKITAQSEIGTIKVSKPIFEDKGFATIAIGILSNPIQINSHLAFADTGSTGGRMI